MGTTTAIKWTDHTFNPWMGCTKVSPACDHCYAEALGKRTGRVQWGDSAPRVAVSEGYWQNPRKWNAAARAEQRRHRVFCASMADVFEDNVTVLGHRNRLFDVIDSTPWLDWQLLTKRPENVALFIPSRWRHGGFPPNVWIGTTVEDQERAEERIPHLLAIPAAVRFLSCEPLLGPIELRHLWNHCDDHDTIGGFCVQRRHPGVRWIDWVIVGGESGAGHRPLDVDHARSLRDQCEQWGVPFFFKQVGGRTPTAGGDLLDGVEHKQFPEVRS